MWIYYVTLSVACYMLRPPTVAIFREVFCEGILHRTVTQFTNVKCKILSKRIKICRLFSNYQINAHFLYSITIYMLHYNPQHVSSSTLLIFRRSNCIITASGIVTVRRTVCRLRADCSPLSTGILYGCLQRMTIPDAAVI